MEKNNIKKIIAANLKKYREALNLQKKDVAEFLHVSPSSVTHWEDGSNSIDINKLSSLCELFHVNLVDMIADDNDSVSDFALSDFEKQLVLAFREHPEMQQAVNKMLDIDSVSSAAVADDLKREIAVMLASERRDSVIRI